ncbi:peptidase inhibitor family I36 [Kribbella sp. VKM Ac-2569]|uniref:peptidase inhibitor family I36 protein n=1 Tax=Kribbella sp. VKM Ac-2569 TaxID=2512220 RepID=UPI00102C59C2|nr:peptidase inhibitor family I36 protein [Kribbella sp. VKM Ac-2569]RZT17448.1 peptidase inhibitor family I36 [Kribbella sp. VKM Ac-2569]
MKRVKYGVGVMALAAGVLSSSSVAGAAPASDAGAAGWPICERSRICIWQGAQFEGFIKLTQVPVTPGSCRLIWFGGSSVFNNSSVTQRLYTSKNCTGTPRRDVAPGAYISDLGYEYYSLGG